MGKFSWFANSFVSNAVVYCCHTPEELREREEEIRMIDLQEYLEFPVLGSGRALPMVSINEKGLLTRNRAFLVETGGVEEFRAYIHKTGWQILLFPQGEPNLCFRKSGARNKELARQLRGQGYSFPVRYDFQWDQESQAWVGTCREMGEPPALSPEKTIGRGKGGRKRS